MAEVISNSGQMTGIPAPFPRLTGEFIPAIDQGFYSGGLGIVVPWGGGQTVRESMLNSMDAVVAGGKTPEAQQMSALMNAILPTGITNYNYFFEGLIGPPGNPGPPGPQGIGITSYIGGAGTPSTALVADVPFTNGITFTKSGSNVVWTAGTLRYKGTTYSISAEATGDTNKYIYWDKDTTPTTFLTTNTLATAMGADKWIMCYNDAGDPYPATSNKVFHAGIIEASTIDTIHINANAITANEIFANTITYNELRQTSGSEAVDTGAIRDNAVSLTASGFTGGSIAVTTGSDATLEDAAMTTEGGNIQVIATAQFRCTLYGNNTFAVKIYRDANLLYSSTHYLGNNTDYFPLTIAFTDTGASAAAHTYYLKAISNIYDGDAINRAIDIMELKK